MGTGMSEHADNMSVHSDSGPAARQPVEAAGVVDPGGLIRISARRAKQTVSETRAPVPPFEGTSTIGNRRSWRHRRPVSLQQVTPTAPRPPPAGKVPFVSARWETY